MAAESLDDDALRQTAAEFPRTAGVRATRRPDMMIALAQQVAANVLDLMADTSFGNSLRGTPAIGQALADRLVAAARKWWRFGSKFESAATRQKQVSAGGSDEKNTHLRGYSASAPHPDHE